MHRTRGQGKFCVIAGIPHSLVSPRLISFSRPSHFPLSEGQESFPAKLDGSSRAAMELSSSAQPERFH